MNNEKVNFPNGMVSIEDFEEWFISVMLDSKDLDDLANKVDYLITDEYILQGFILANTEWDEEIVSKANAKTICYWYLLYLLYMYNGNDNTVAGNWVDEIYQFLDAVSF